MGCYDSLYAKCECGGRAEFQSKIGLCVFNEYSIDDVPPGVAEELNNEVEYCDRCGKSCRLKFKIICLGQEIWK